MKQLPIATTFWILVVVIFGFAGEGQAQTPSLGVGYQALHLPDNWVTAGFNLDGAASVTEQLSIVGEFGLSHESAPGSGTGQATLYHFGAGPRWSWPGRQVRPYVQAIAGAEVTAAEISSGGGGTTEDSDTAFMLQPGAGVYVPVGIRWGAFAQADIRWVFFEGDADNQARLVFGVRFALR
jgi:hypothetical protein